jgi:uncharacterized membrane protein
MSSGSRKAIALIALAVLGPQAVHAHSGKDAIPMLVAMPFGQAISAVVLVFLAIRAQQGKLVASVVGSASVLTSVLVWLFEFPLLDSLLLLVPASLGSAIVLFCFYGFLTSALSGFMCGRLFRHLVSQHAQSFGGPPE